jgi:hypothetical protein
MPGLQPEGVRSREAAAAQQHDLELRCCDNFTVQQVLLWVEPLQGNILCHNQQQQQEQQQQQRYM